MAGAGNLDESIAAPRYGSSETLLLHRIEKLEIETDRKLAEGLGETENIKPLVHQLHQVLENNMYLLDGDARFSELERRVDCLERPRSELGSDNSTDLKGRLEGLSTKLERTLRNETTKLERSLRSETAAAALAAENERRTEITAAAAGAAAAQNIIAGMTRARSPRSPERQRYSLGSKHDPLTRQGVVLSHHPPSDGNSQQAAAASSNIRVVSPVRFRAQVAQKPYGWA
jgi:hypothetical protein